MVAAYNSTGDLSYITKYTSANVMEGIDYYTEQGLTVFTAWYLLKRGYCCDNGCRHCPYHS